MIQGSRVFLYGTSCSDYSLIGKHCNIIAVITVITRCKHNLIAVILLQ